MNDLKFKTVMFLLRGVARLPFCVLYFLSDIIRFFVAHVVKYRKRVIMMNLRNSFPERSESELVGIMHGYYRHMCDLIVETVKLLHMSDRQLTEHIEVLNSGLVERLAQDGSPIVVFLGHYGNWEWVQEVTRHYSRPALNAEIYRPLKDKISDRMYHVIRSRFNTEQIPQHKAVRRLLQLKNEGKQFLVGFISDQRPNSDNLNHWTKFLNQDTAYAAGGEEIGRHVGAKYVYLEVRKPRRGHYRMTFNEIIPTDPAEKYPYTLAFMHMLEETINREPQFWLWSHNRWKFKRNNNKGRVEKNENSSVIRP